MTTWDSIKEKATEVADTVSDKFNKMASTAGTEYSILKQKRAISLYEAEINEIEQAMGKRVFELHGLDKIEDRELIARCNEIEAVRKRIEETEEEIEQLREQEAKAEDEKAKAEDEKAEETVSNDHGHKSHEDDDKD
jgi:predicted RNase H-like nuclease (RuvC/YqgF family)